MISLADMDATVADLKFASGGDVTVAMDELMKRTEEEDRVKEAAAKAVEESEQEEVIDDGDILASINLVTKPGESLSISRVFLLWSVVFVESKIRR